MNAELQRGIISAYNKSGKNKRKFEKEVEKETGLKKHVLYRSGPIGNLVSTFMFAEGITYKGLRALVKKTIKEMKLNEAGDVQKKKKPIIDEGQKIADLFNKEIKKIFPKQYGEANVRSQLGVSVLFTYGNLDPKEVAKDWKNWRNNSQHVGFIMNMTSSSGAMGNASERAPIMSIDISSRAFELKNKGLKFRRINGKTPEELVKKLLMWFKKNKDLLTGK